VLVFRRRKILQRLFRQYDGGLDQHPSGVRGQLKRQYTGMCGANIQHLHTVSPGATRRLQTEQRQRGARDRGQRGHRQDLVQGPAADGRHVRQDHTGARFAHHIQVSENGEMVESSETEDVSSTVTLRQDLTVMILTD
jgi:hypothetical protein